MKLRKLMLLRRLKSYSLKGCETLLLSFHKLIFKRLIGKLRSSERPLYKKCIQNFVWPIIISNKSFGLKN